MNLLVVRHAESLGNATGDYSTATHDALSPRGHQQAMALADQLQAWTFDRIVVSPLQRTMETVTPYLQATRQQAELWPEIAEACWHEQREPASDAWRPRPAALPDGLADLFAFRDGWAVEHTPPETFGQGLRRVHDALHHLEGMAQEGPTILMVTHGHFIRELLNLMLGTSDHAGHVDNCGMTWLTFDQAWQLSSPPR